MIFYKMKFMQLIAFCCTLSFFLINSMNRSQNQENKKSSLFELKKKHWNLDNSFFGESYTQTNNMLKLHHSQSNTPIKNIPSDKQMPLVLIGVPGNGFLRYSDLNFCYQYIKTFFGDQNENLSYIIASSPGFNANISADNYKKNKDFKFFKNHKGEKTYKDIWTNPKQKLTFNDYNKICCPNKLLGDLGQENCQKIFKESVIPKLNTISGDCLRVIFHGNSQGTATILNYLASLVGTKYDQQNKTFKMGEKNILIKAIILEAPLATGKTPMHHILRGYVPTSLKWFPYTIWPSLMPYFLYHKLPAIAKYFNIAAHDPKKIQPIDSIQKIPTDIPIIIAHAEKDPIVPFSDGKALYYARTQTAPNNTYFLPFKEAEHVFLFQQDTKNLPHLDPDNYLIPIDLKPIQDAHSNKNTDETESISNKFKPKNDFGKIEYENIMKNL